MENKFLTPWHVEETPDGWYAIINCNGEKMFRFYLKQKSFADMIIACVNALEGIDDPAEFVRIAKVAIETVENMVGEIPLEEDAPPTLPIMTLEKAKLLMERIREANSPEPFTEQPHSSVPLAEVHAEVTHTKLHKEIDALNEKLFGYPEQPAVNTTKTGKGTKNILAEQPAPERVLLVCGECDKQKNVRTRSRQMRKRCSKGR